MKYVLTILSICLVGNLWAGNDPCSATEVLPNMLNFETFSNVGTSHSGQGIPACGSYQGNDFWLEFTAPASGAVTIELEAGTITDAAINLYVGLCGTAIIGYEEELGCYQDYDCGLDLMPKVSFDDLFPGHTYFIQVWSEGGGTGTFDIRLTNPFQQQFVTSGTAFQYFDGDLNCVQLTPEATSTSGCVWYPESIDFTQPFVQNFSLNFGDDDVNGADGITIVFQPNGTNACGGVGQGLGAQGIQESWIIEFDTWYNADFTDITDDHVAININGNMANPIYGPIGVSNIEDGNDHLAIVRWDPATNNFKVELDGQVLLDVNYDIINDVFGGDTDIFWGATSSTGGSFNTQSFCFLGVTLTNKTSYTFNEYEVICEGNSLFVGGNNQTTEGQYFDVFTALNGCDSTVITNLTIASVEAVAVEMIQLPCEGGTELVLDGSLSNVGDQPSILWTATNGGTIVSGQNTLTPTVSGGGTYRLSILDTSTGCSDVINVEVLPGEMPTADAGAPAMLDCQTPEFQLDGTGSSDETYFSYEWTTTDGTISADTFTMTPTITAAGTYTLVVTNTFNDCSAEASVTITANQDVPTAIAMAEASLDCTNTSVLLNAAGSDEGSDISYGWFGPDGLPIPGSHGLTLMVDEPGTYLLIVTNSTSDCNSSYPVTVLSNIDLPTAQIEPSIPLDCSISELFLNGENSSQGTEFTYEWTSSDGPITSTANPLNPSITMAGDYQLVVTNTTNNCTAVAEISITSNADLPLADAGADATLSCNDSSAQLDGSASDSGTNLTYSWTSLDGNLVVNSLGVNPTVNGGGTYELTVTNEDNGCTATDGVFVAYDTLSPQMTLAEPALLTCTTTSISLPVTPLNDTGDFTYTWTTTGGQIDTGMDTASPTVSATGSYTLLVTNPDNGCTTNIGFSVSEDTNIPEVNLDTPALLNCMTTSVALLANPTTGVPLTYDWSNANGNSIQDATTQNPSVTAAGTYDLVITNTDNGCTNTNSVTVNADLTPPMAEAGDSQELDCSTSSLFLTGESTGNVTYQWTSTDGVILNGGTTATPEINAAGTYQLLVTNTDNACTATDNVTITQDNNIPIADAGPDATIDCITQSILLDASLSSSGTDYTFAWSSLEGNNLMNETTLTPSVSDAGTYTLTITDILSNCTAVSTVEIFENTTTPDFTLAQPDMLDCSGNPVDLTVEGLLSGNYTYDWTSTDGTFMGGQAAATAAASSAGTYQVLITNTDNGCSNTSSVPVLENADVPMFSIPTPDTLDCTTNEVVLESTALADDTDWTYAWQTSDGNLIFGASPLNPLATTAATYELVVINTSNGCSSTQSIAVVQDNDVPIADAGIDGILNCTTPSLELDASQSTLGANISYEWSTADGFIESGATTTNPLISQAGTYTLTLLNTTNNCSAVSTVEITVDTDTPQFSINSPTMIDCDNTSSDLTITGLDTGDYSYTWSSVDGTIVGDINSNNITAQSAGTYELLVSNNANTCSETASVTVSANAETPMLSIALPDTINCQVSTVDLLTSTTADDSNWTYEWTDAAGTLLANTANTQANATGMYQLLVTNTTNDCMSTQAITVAENLLAPVIMLAPSEQLDCGTNSVELDAQGTTAAMTYEWIPPTGSTAVLPNTPSISVSEAGSYQFIATNTSSMCTATETITVNQDITQPTALISEPALLTCAVESIQLDALGSSTGTDIVLEWTSPDASIAAGADGLSPSISEAGNFTLLLTNTANECTAMASVEVFQNNTLPTADIAEPSLLTCINTSIGLDAFNSSEGTSLVYTWASNDGNIVNTDTELNPQIDAPGTYTLTILDTANDCSAMTSVEVFENIEFPEVSIEMPATLDCAVTEIVLDASNSSTGGDFQYEWTSTTGEFVSGTTALMPTVTEAGIYNLAVTNTINGCVTTAMTEVTADELLPQASIANPPMLNCATDAIQLDANNLGVMAVEYLWTTTTGEILIGETTATPMVNAPGIYEVTLTNPDNACSDTQMIEVFQDIEAPFVDAGTAEELTCTINSTDLNAQASEGNEFELVWQTADGNVLSGVNSLQAVVNQAGTYTLVVTNTMNFCTASDAVLVVQNENIPTGLNVTPIPPLCFGDLGGLTFDSVEGGEGPFVYSIDGGMNFVQETDFENLTPATYDLYIEDINGCSLTTNLVVPAVEAVFAYAEPEIQLSIGETQAFQASTNIPSTEPQTFEWTPADGLSCTDCLEPICTNPFDQLYTLTVTNSNGCTATAEVQLRVESEINIYVPNAFSPYNEDGINDAFTIYAKEQSIANIRKMLVFDRWGNLVFENYNFLPNDPNMGWDGLFKNKTMQPAVFVWYAEIELITGATEVLKGDVTLMK